MNLSILPPNVENKQLINDLRQHPPFFRHPFFFLRFPRCATCVGGAFVALSALGTFDQILIYAPLLEDNLVTSIDIEVPRGRKVPMPKKETDELIVLRKLHSRRFLLVWWCMFLFFVCKSYTCESAEFTTERYRRCRVYISGLTKNLHILIVKYGGILIIKGLISYWS